MNVNDLFFALCRFEICGTELPDGIGELTDCDTTELFKLSRHHDSAHLVSDALFKNGLIFKRNACFEEFKKVQMKAIYRYERIAYELERTSCAFETAEIPFILLKGSYLRRFYPEPWMRTSSDIDILVHEGDLDKAYNILEKSLCCKFYERGSHDIAFVSESGLLIELHFDLIESARYPTAVKVLERAWDFAVLKDGFGYRYELKDEMFFFYHIAHMVKHFENGGCGVRSFIDLWILEHSVEHCDSKRDELLKKGGLYKFAEAARSLAEAWLSCKEPNELDLLLQSYILKGGTFGVTENGVVVKQVKQGSRSKYILSRLFPAMSIMKKQYPELERHPWLAPLVYLKRALRVFTKDTRQRAKRQLYVSASVSREQAEQTAALLNMLGL